MYVYGLKSVYGGVLEDALFIELLRFEVDST